MTSEQAAALLTAVLSWAQFDPAIEALLVVGSFANGTQRQTSDLDLIILTSSHSFLEDTNWAEGFGTVKFSSVETWGVVSTLRVHYEGDMEVEFNFAPANWADFPLDGGTEAVLRDGFRVLVDKNSRFARMAEMLK